jgi:hypothetical protein
MTVERKAKGDLRQPHRYPDAYGDKPGHDEESVRRSN